MGMQQKLDRAYREGFEDGKKENQDLIELRGAIKGSAETWELMEEMFMKIEGIGPKTREKILKAIKLYAKREKDRLQREMRL